jgi:hypothetical protein
MLPFVQRVQFNPISTAVGSTTFTLPPAGKNQAVEVIIKKTSSDANTITPVPTPGSGDVIDDAAPLTTASPYVRYISDGVNGWYLIT